jgi:hypothetical protein
MNQSLLVSGCACGLLSGIVTNYSGEWSDSDASLERVQVRLGHRSD